MDRIVTVTLNTAIDRLVEVEGFCVGGHLSGRRLARVHAGKGVNVSRALSALGVPSVATGFVGRGELEAYELSLADTDVLPQFLAIEGDTRENITLIDPKAGVETHVREAGAAPTAGDLERLRNKLNLLTESGGLVVLSGSLPPGVSIDYTIELVDALLAKGMRVAVDGPGELLRALAGRKLWLVKPNLDELVALCEPGVSGDEETVRVGRLLSKYVEVVIVTCGAAGGYLFADGCALLGQVEFDATRVRSSVGCGDCMLAAFIAAQREGCDVRTSYERALAVATAAAVDAHPGLFDPATAAELLGVTSVVPVA